MLKPVLCLLLGAPLLASAQWQYPMNHTVDHTDTYQDTQVADPYRWLEDVDSPETAAWVAAENKVTFDFLATIPERDAIRKRLDELYNYPRYSLPSKRGGHYFYTYNSGLQNQSPLYVKDRLDDEGRVLIDPNTLSNEGTVALTTYDASPDGRWLAYGTAAAGSDWNTFRVRDIATATDTADVLNWVKFSGITWTHDSAGFFYSRYPEPSTDGNTTFSGLANQAIYYHRIGTNQSEDAQFFAIPEHPKWSMGASLSDDGRYVLIYIREGTDPRRRLYYVDLKNADHPDLTGEVVKLIDVLEAEYSEVGNDGPVFYFTTDLDAPRRRIIAIDFTNSARDQWRTVVPEDDAVIDSVRTIGGIFIVNKMRDAHSELLRYDHNGKLLGTIALPGIGQVGGISGRHDDNELFFSYTSFVFPSASFLGDASTGEFAPYQAPKLDFDPSLYETNQVFYPSKDGTRIPMFITHRKGIKLDGSHPTLLYGYGGFNISLQPSFSSSNVAWLELGGIYAVPNLRGGGEYGSEWHLAGTKERKQNVFDDFAAAGDYLVAQGYTSHKFLALRGRSNGGLLVAATLLQRPDLARVAIPGVGVLDMLRFHQFTIGWAWIADYGSSDTPEGFNYLRAYSPLHNVKAGVDYPAVLITTGDHDDRVHPAHSFKFAATMQAANPLATSPRFIRIETNAGHGAGKPIAKLLDETADELAFIRHFVGHGAN